MRSYESDLKHRIGDIILFIAVVMILASRPAAAHLVRVFAWAEEGMVHTESRFSGGKSVKGGTISVQDDTGRLLLQGKSDASGLFSFNIPKPSSLKITLEAGMGHQNSWTITRKEIDTALMAKNPESPGVKTKTSAQKDKTGKKSRDTQGPRRKTAGTETTLVAASGIGEETTQWIEASMEDKLAPLNARIRQLEKRAQRQRWTDILAGIGYIFGLVGMAAYFSSRKKAGIGYDQ